MNGATANRRAHPSSPGARSGPAPNLLAALETQGLTKRYGRRTALNDCTLSIPTGRVVGLVGPNGAGKSTLLQLAVGLLRPSAGEIRVLGGVPAADPEQLARVAFVAQDAPVYGSLSVGEHLTMGAKLNPRWDAELAATRIARLGLDPAQKAGGLSGGQRAQLALTLAVARRPDLLILDEPVASLDPLARRDFLAALMEFVAQQPVGVILSSHLIADLERVCDHLVVLAASQVQITGDVEDLLGSHHRLTGARIRDETHFSGWNLVHATHTDRQSTLVVRSSAPIDDPDWHREPLTLEDLVLAYMSRAADAGADTAGGRVLEAQR